MDSAKALKLDPRWIDLYLTRANIFRNQGKEDLALAEAASVAAANPDEAYAHVVSANIYSAFKKRPEAMRAFDRAIALKPEAYVYLNRSLARPPEDVAARQADIDAAIKLEPNSGEALAMKAALQVEAGKFTDAVETYSKAVVLEPKDPSIMVRRGLAYARAGQTALAAKDFAAGRAMAKEANQLNSLCWAKATAGIALESALSDCDEALTKSPNEASYLDSRGLVLLRLGRIDDAIKDYDRALAARPGLSSSLFGRAIAWSKKGDRAKAAADLNSAEKINPEVKEDFKRYGVMLN
jgi:tetratricopeptide (TPR) repeat protein